MSKKYTKNMIIKYCTKATKKLNNLSLEQELSNYKEIFNIIDILNKFNNKTFLNNKEVNNLIEFIEN